MPEGVLCRFVVAAQKIDIENVLPRPPAHWPRFNLTQADVAQGKHTQRLEQRSRHILHLERNGRLVGSARNQMMVMSFQARVPRFSPLLRELRLSLHAVKFSNEKKPREVALFIFDSGLQNLSGILTRG